MSETSSFGAAPICYPSENYLILYRTQIYRGSLRHIVRPSLFRLMWWDFSIVSEGIDELGFSILLGKNGQIHPDSVDRPIADVTIRGFACQYLTRPLFCEINHVLVLSSGCYEVGIYTSVIWTHSPQKMYNGNTVINVSWAWNYRGLTVLMIFPCCRSMLSAMKDRPLRAGHLRPVTICKLINEFRRVSVYTNLESQGSFLFRPVRRFGGLEIIVRSPVDDI